MALELGYGYRTGDFVVGTPYRVVRALGYGGMGEVYEVDHMRTGTRRALKLLSLAADPRSEPAQRLKREGDLLRAMDHRNVVRVYEVDVLSDGRPFFAMEVLEGCSLRELLDQHGHLPVERAVLIAAQALRGLGYAHEQGIVHRDVKPSNLMVGRDDVTKILDFGIAKVTSSLSSCSLTGQGVALGTLKYMAPEQLCGRAVDQRADIYAMGLVLFEALAGVCPFHGHATKDARIYARLTQPAPRVDSVSRQFVPADVADIVAEMLITSWSARASSASSLAAKLMAAIGRSVWQLDTLGVELSYTTRVDMSVVRRSESSSCVAERASVPPVEVPKEVTRDPVPECAKRDPVPLVALCLAIAAVATFLSVLVLRDISQGYVARRIVAGMRAGAFDGCASAPAKARDK